METCQGHLEPKGKWKMADLRRGPLVELLNCYHMLGLQASIITGF